MFFKYKYFHVRLTGTNSFKVINIDLSRLYTRHIEHSVHFCFIQNLSISDIPVELLYAWFDFKFFFCYFPCLVYDKYLTRILSHWAYFRMIRLLACLLIPYVVIYETSIKKTEPQKHCYWHGLYFTFNRYIYCLSI